MSWLGAANRSISPVAPPPPSNSIIWIPGVHMGVYNFGGAGNNSLAVWKAEALMIANANSSRIVKGFEVHGTPQVWFPTAQGDWANSLGISLLIQMFQYIATLPNQPAGGYALSASQNLVGNTFPAGTLTDSFARSITPTWWYDNSAFGPTGGNNTTGGPHGGVYWNTTTGLNHLWWNAAVLADVVSCWRAIWQAVENAGFHIYRLDTCMEMAAATVTLNAGYSDSRLLSAWTGSSGFAKNLRNAMPNSLLNCKPTFAPAVGSNMDAFLGDLHAHQWSPGNYDHCNETVPADSPAFPTTLPNGETAPIKARHYNGDLGQRGQQAVGGPTLNTNWKALGYDYHAHSSNDTLRNRPTNTAPIPNTNIGSGRLPDYLTHLTEVGMSHYYVVSQRDGGGGAPCNSLGHTGSTPNYNYPYTGPIMPDANIIAALARLGVNSFLNLNYPSAWP